MFCQPFCLRLTKNANLARASAQAFEEAPLLWRCECGRKGRSRAGRRHNTKLAGAGSWSLGATVRTAIEQEGMPLPCAEAQARSHSCSRL